MAKVTIVQWSDKVLNQLLDEDIRAIKIELLNGVIENTPVKTGRLKGNWQTTTGSPNISTTERLDPNGTAAMNEVRNTVTPDGIDFMTNNLPYAAAQEERRGMVAMTVARIQQVVRGFSDR